MARSLAFRMSSCVNSQNINMTQRWLTTFIRSGSLYNVIGKGHGQAKDWTYHDQMAVDKSAAKPSICLTPYQMLYAGKFADGTHLVKSAQYLQKELPIRIARRIVDFQRLSYIITANPVIYDVYELYLRAFKLLSSFPKVEDLNGESKYSQMIRRLLDDHQNVVLCLAEGFNQVKDHIPYETMATFLDRTLTSRLGIRMLAEHHLGLRHERPNFIGVICTNLSVKMLIERCGDYARQICEHTYGLAPEILINGHKKDVFPYVPAPLEYILQELFKNSMRATVETNQDSSSYSQKIPPIVVTICTNDTDFIIRISDQGGGIATNELEDVLKYSFTTTKERNEPMNDKSHFGLGDLAHHANNSPTGGPMSGYGFGLPTSKAYAEYLGGSLKMMSMEGLGTDLYLRLRHIDGKKESFRI